MSEWYLYIIRCRNGNLYTGITTDVARRFAEHQGKGNTGAKYLRGRGPLILVFQRKVGNKNLAMSVENRVKRLSKVRKEELVKANAHIDKIINQTLGIASQSLT